MLQKEYQDYLDNMLSRMDNAKIQECPECGQSKWGITIEPSISLVCTNCEYSYVDDLLNRMILPYLPKTQKEFDENQKTPVIQFMALCAVFCAVFEFLGKKEK
tara:strand:- start:201 stop:509 length:309 start_codon:yes stop_codon:yes gene_type:complete